MVSTLVLLGLLALGAPDAGLAVAARTASVVVRTDLGETWAAATAKAVEAERARLEKELGPLLGRRRSPRPLTIVAFRSSAAYRRYATTASPAHVLELGWYDPARAVAVVHTDTGFPARHEAAHWILREVLALPDRDDLPVWVVEGIPCLVEDAPAYRLRRLAEALEAGLDPAVGLRAAASDLGRGHDDALYAAAWATAELLRSRHAAAYRAFLAGISPDGDLPDLAKLAGMEPEALAEEVRQHTRARAKDPLRLRSSALYPALVPDPQRPADPSEVGRQVEFLRHPDLEVQRSAMRWFEHHEHPDVVPALEAALPEGSGSFRLNACRILAKHDADRLRPVPWLIDLLESEEAELRLAAARTLRRLAREDFGFRPHDDEETRGAAIARWRAWLKSR